MVKSLYALEIILEKDQFSTNPEVKETMKMQRRYMVEIVTVNNQRILKYQLERV